MKNLKIGTRLLTGFLFMVVLIVGISVFSYVELRTIEEQADQMAAANAQAFALLAGSAQGVPAELKSRAETSHGKSLAAYRSAVISLAVGCTLAALAAIALAVLISRSIIVPLRAMTGVMRDIAEGEGDLTKNIHLDSKDELGELSKWFDMFMDNIQEDITHLGKSTHQIAAAAAQLHATAAQIAADAAEVAEQAEKVATAGEEMSASSADIARSCGMAVESSRFAGDAAVSGARVVNETIAVMNSIAGRVKETASTEENLGGRSEQIGAIVGTIQEIADQTNLLALNAAIEAARAGEQGRGFAVVADEVRKLAERTRKATAEISEMIRSIQSETKEAVAAMETGVDEVARGSEKAAESGNALARILEQINRVAEQINQVARAAEEQTAVTTEISNNMHQITEVVARSSSGARETTKAADGLSEQARELDSIVGQFKV